MRGKPAWRAARTDASTARALTFLRKGASLAPPPHERHEAFVHLVRGDTRAQSLALLTDEGPAVRAYAAECLLREHPDDVASVYPLLRDAAEILLLTDGGGGSMSSVGEYVLRTLRNLRDRAAPLRTAFERAVAEGFAKPPQNPSP